MEKLDPSKRLILAAIIAFVFFAFYDHYVIGSRTQSVDQSVQTTAQAENPQQAAPKVESEPKIEAVQATTEAPKHFVANSALATVKTGITTLEIDTLGRIKQATLSGEIFEDDNHAQLELFSTAKVSPLEIRFSDGALNSEAFATPYTASTKNIDASNVPATLVLTQKLSALTVTKTIIFYPDGHYDLTVDLSSPADYFITNGSHPEAAFDQMTLYGSLIHTADGTVEVIESGDAKGTESFRLAKMVSSFDRYYASILFNYENPLDIYINRIGDKEPLPFVRGASNLKLSGYVGPKYVEKLRAIHPELTNAVEYGFFTFLSKPLFAVLEWIYEVVPSWGWSIVIFTILVKIVLFPLAHKGMVSMAKLKDLAPKMKELQAKYKDDKQKLQIHMMELYKKHGANPLGGCLPLLLQIPIFFAIYRVLLNAIELKGAEWFYISDLSIRDPFFLLPLLMGATMWFQQRITPSNFTDPMQEKIFKWLPVIFTFFFLFFPAGLVLYWLVNNIISIAQQWFVNKQIERAKLKLRTENEKN